MQGEVRFTQDTDSEIARRGNKEGPLQESFLFTFAGAQKPSLQTESWVEQTSAKACALSWVGVDDDPSQIELP